MIALIFLLALLKLVQSAALKKYPVDRMFCYFALSLALESQSPYILWYEEDDVHGEAHSTRILGKNLGPGFQRVHSIAEKKYIEYLKKLRATRLGRMSFRDLVEDVTMKNVREYLPANTKVNALRYKPVVSLLRSINSSPENTDNVRLELYKNAIAALDAFAAIHHDYRDYARFPKLEALLSLKHLEDFIEKNFVILDFGATYPDMFMCLSFLQYLKYIALVDGHLDTVADISRLYVKALEALENMSIAPLDVFHYMTYKGKISVAIMPQAVKGPKPVPICITPFENGTMVQISVLDVKYPKNSKYVYEQLKHLDEFVAIMS